MDFRRGLIAFIFVILAASVPTNVATSADNQAKGTLTYKSYSLTLKYAWLVKGPSEMDPHKTIRRLILSANDISPKLQECTTMWCASGQVTEGMTVDFDTPPRLDYWVAVNGQKVQYSFGAMPEAFVARINDAGHLAGELTINDIGAGGPKVDAEFDVAVFKEFSSD
jgi:hypothetical protein